MHDSFPPGLDPELLVRYLASEATAPERRQVDDWLAADPTHQRYAEDLRRLWERSAAAGDFAAFDAEADWQQVKTRMNPAWGRTDRPALRLGNRWHAWQRIAAAVVLVLGLALGLGGPVRRYLSGSERSTAAGTAPVRITLADGTKVSLNAGARLSYPERFSGAQRAVTLTGEAFFEVTENKAQPFVITTGAVSTRVLGTSFVVNAPREDSVLVTVLTGKVALSATGQAGNRLVMTPGERGTYRQGRLVKSPNPDPNFLAWQTGVLTFRNTPLPVVVRDLERHYRQPIRLGSEALAACRLTSSFSRQPLPEVLAELELVLPLRAETRGDTLLLTGEGCRPATGPGSGD
ncbi:MAG: FecR domain-containing protein [Cytophagales bacterium]|nr:FecR domain-containing protein [Cytophagales bacterium]